MPIRPRREPIAREEEGITLTPLIDCVFLLLIFFMVTTVFKEVRVLVIELPEARKSEVVEEKKLTVTIDKEGRFDVNGKLVGLGELESVLLQMHSESRSNTLIIQTDKLTEHRFVLDCMQAAKRIGIEKIVLATEKEKEEV